MVRSLDFAIAGHIVGLMAIIRDESKVADGILPLAITNGDLDVLKKAVERLGFKDEESLLRFVLAVMSQSATRTLSIIDQNGKNLTLNPSASVLKPPDPEQTPAPPAPPVSEKQPA